MSAETTARNLHFDDVTVGEPISFGRYRVSEAELVGFARAFDPQPFHLSDEGARDSIPGRLFASGFHTCAMMMNMLATDLLKGSAALGSPGIDEARFLKPIFPGDELSARGTCLSKRTLSSRPGIGVCRFRFEMLKAGDVSVMVWESSIFLRQRAPVAGDGAGLAAP